MPFLNDFLVTTKKSVISENNKQQGARKMSDSGKLVKQNNRYNIDTTTRISQANELPLLLSVFTFRILLPH